MHALVVGRFQPLHRGHVQLIQAALEDCVHCTVAIGSSNAKQSAKNPFSADEREAMITAVFGDRVRVVRAPDIHDPPNWAAHVVSITGEIDKVFGNDPRTLDLFEDDGIKVGRPGYVKRDLLEGSTIRMQMAEGDPAWRKAVPDAVAEFLDSIDGPKRLRLLEVNA